MKHKKQILRVYEPKVSKIKSEVELCDCDKPKPLLKDMYDKTTCNNCRKEIKHN